MDDPESDAEREELLKEVADLASWDAVRHPDRVVRTKEDGGSSLTGTELLERVRRRILDDNEGTPPKLLDPFAGGGAIPLEGLRLGCEVEASDLNPVAVLIPKGTVEYPQKFGQPDSRPVPDYILRAAPGGSQTSFIDGDMTEAYRRNPLATDVGYWGNIVLERAREELAQFYPPDTDGNIPVAYLWTRTIACPSCHGEMPLLRQYWLARKLSREVALDAVVHQGAKAVDFRIVQGADILSATSKVTNVRGDTKCLLCGQVVKASYIRHASASGKIGATPTAVVVETDSGKKYRSDTDSDMEAFQAARRQLEGLDAIYDSDLSLIPHEPTSSRTLGMRVTAYGLDEWGKLFNERQLLSLITLARIVNETHDAILETGQDPTNSKAVTTYLAFVLDRFANTYSTLARLMSSAGAGIIGTFARQALSMVWDYAEANPFGRSASWSYALEGVIRPLLVAMPNTPRRTVRIQMRDATARRTGEAPAMVLTDPPYYDAIDYAGLSDFFYVWLKRSVGSLYPYLFDLPLSPKKQQAIMASEKSDPIERQRYVTMMAEAFQAMSQSLRPGGLAGVVFAHTNPDAWATLNDGLLGAGLVPDASWPIDTKLQNKVSAGNRANLKTSVWMACQKREREGGNAFLSDVTEQMRPVRSGCFVSGVGVSVELTSS